MVKSELEQTLIGQIRMVGLPAPEREYRFAPPRMYRFDLAWPQLRLAAEVMGGLHTGGAHVRPRGYNRDCEKHNLGVLKGWAILLFTRQMIETGDAIRTLEQALGWKS